MWMLLPAVASVVALVALAAGLRAVSGAAAELTTSLRRFAAAAVAGDELSRDAASVGERTESTRARAERLRRRGGRASPQPQTAPS